MCLKRGPWRAMIYYDSKNVRSTSLSRNILTLFLRMSGAMLYVCRKFVYRSVLMLKKSILNIYKSGVSRLHSYPISQFLSYVDEQKKHYRTDNVVVTMGGDFTYQDARMWYKNLDKLIERCGDHKQQRRLQEATEHRSERINVFFLHPRFYKSASFTLNVFACHPYLVFALDLNPGPLVSQNVYLRTNNSDGQEIHAACLFPRFRGLLKLKRAGHECHCIATSKSIILIIAADFGFSLYRALFIQLVGRALAPPTISIADRGTLILSRYASGAFTTIVADASAGAAPALALVGVERGCFSGPSSQCSNIREILIRLHDKATAPLALPLRRRWAGERSVRRGSVLSEARASGLTRPIELKNTLMDTSARVEPRYLLARSRRS
ncbi:Lysosomal alpha-mannosidase [Eumeta japonica]|uniref:Lysosomal alpha-mannosidase n=1 Tax=Eumeta variegata TaxID=151549 RepID=A0A4C1ZFJ3_EUMVA|nr:Lysosomal alpha-mannosidase [Eumeta japonica]